jgi:hypothetical protein
MAPLLIERWKNSITGGPQEDCFTGLRKASAADPVGLHRGFGIVKMSAQSHIGDGERKAACGVGGG